MGPRICGWAEALDPSWCVGSPATEHSPFHPLVPLGLGLRLVREYPGEVKKNRGERPDASGEGGAPRAPPGAGDEQGPKAHFQGWRGQARSGQSSDWGFFLFGVGASGREASPCLRARFEQGNPFASPPSLPRLKTVGELLLRLLPEALRDGGGGCGEGRGPAPVCPCSSACGGRGGGSSCHRDQCRRTHREAGVGGGSFSHCSPHPPHQGPPWPSASPAGPLSPLPGPMGQAGSESEECASGVCWVLPAPDSGLRGSRGSWSLWLRGGAGLAMVHRSPFPGSRFPPPLAGGLYFRAVLLCLRVEAAQTWP